MNMLPMATEDRTMLNTLQGYESAKIHKAVSNVNRRLKASGVPASTEHYWRNGKSSICAVSPMMAPEIYEGW